MATINLALSPEELHIINGALEFSSEFAPPQDDDIERMRLLRQLVLCAITQTMPGGAYYTPS